MNEASNLDDGKNLATPTMDVMILTGFHDTKDVLKLLRHASQYPEKGYQYVKFERIDSHPRKLFNGILDWCKSLGCYGGKEVFWTNNDHEINACRVAMKRGYIRSFVVWHCDGDKCFEINCDKNGEFDKYPDGFLDQWPIAMGNLA